MKLSKRHESQLPLSRLTGCELLLYPPMASFYEAYPTLAILYADNVIRMASMLMITLAFAHA
jgi:hypothetical protein